MSLASVIAQRHRNTGPVLSLDFHPALALNYAGDAAVPGSVLITPEIGPSVNYSRASGATQIGPAGFIEWAPENLLNNSAYIAGWSQTGVVATWGFPDPIGGNAASKLVPNGGMCFLYQFSQAPVFETVTFSVWLKSATGANVSLVLTYNAASTPGPTPITVTPVWQRFTHTAYVQAGDAWPMIGHTSIAEWSTGEDIYAWGAQMERHPTARKYIATTSTPVYVPAIDHAPVTLESLGLRIEEQRTNMALQSGNLTILPWQTYLASVLISAEASPIQGASVTQVDFTAGNSAQVYQVPINGSSPFVVSCWVKSLSGNGKFHLAFYSDTIHLSPEFTATAEWKRFGFAFGATTTGQVSVYCQDLTVKSMLVTGFQAEVGAFPTSYIPTTTAAATRSADLCSISGADFTGFYNQTEGTVVAGGNPQVDSGFCYMFGITTDAPDSNHEIAVRAIGFSLIQAHVASVSLTGQTSHDFNHAFGTPLKLATATRNGEPPSWVKDGGSVFTGTPQTMATFARMTIGAEVGRSWLNGTIARIQYFPARINDNMLIELTQP